VQVQTNRWLEKGGFVFFTDLRAGKTIQLNLSPEAKKQPKTSPDVNCPLGGGLVFVAKFQHKYG
jgi:hypothetical protein